ncbi:hypothetical protein NKH48_27120 [Mesorhizobium sp. M1233]|uniref:hypothetical protein n=1 Tax=Mesorhizobium sp. M1233 TaxID=2957072 RepID=UPI00333CC664
MQFQLPLVRFVDGMPDLQRTTWLRDAALPDVFTLPSPDVRYEIRTLAVGATGVEATSPELDVVAEQKAQRMPEPGKPPLKTSGYRINVVGPLFASPLSTDQLKPRRDTHAPRYWWFDAVAALHGVGAEVTERFQPVIETINIGGADTDQLRAFEIDAAAIGDWSPVAPTAAAILRLLPPPNNPAGWSTFQADAAQWRDAFDPYRAASSAAQDFFDLLADAAANASLAWWQAMGWTNAAGALLDGTLEVAAFAAGLPRLTHGRPTSIRVEAAASAAWVWPLPQDVSLDPRRAVGRLAPTRLAAEYTTDMFVAGVATPVRHEMRALLARRNDGRFRWQENDTPRVLPAFVSHLPQSLHEAALTLGRYAKDDVALPRAIDIVALVRIKTANATLDQLVDLIRAAENADPLTLLDLGPIEDDLEAWVQTDRTLDIHVPCSALPVPGGSPLTTALEPLGAKPDPQRPVSLLLRMPPNDKEREQLIATAKAALDDAAKALVEAAFDAMEEQVFGAGRMPQVKVFHGSADPQTAAVAAAKRGDA